MIFLNPLKAFRLDKIKITPNEMGSTPLSVIARLQLRISHKGLTLSKYQKVIPYGGEAI
jgi:hypothetical protein